MERLGRAPSDEQESYDASSPGHGVYRQRTEDDVRREAGDDRFESSDEPATISHTNVQPRHLEIQSVHLPVSISTPSPEPPGHYTKKKSYKKSTSRSTSKRSDTQSYGSQQSEDYWSQSTSLEGVRANIDERIIVQPMVTRVGPDGRTYIRDTSIEVVKHQVHETPNTKIVYGTPALPNEYRWYAILGMICFFFFGIFAFRKSKQVRVKFDAQKYDEAQEASASARNWANVAVLTGAFVVIVTIFLFFVSPCPLARAFDVPENICPLGT